MFEAITNQVVGKRHRVELGSWADLNDRQHLIDLMRRREGPKSRARLYKQRVAER